LNSASLSSRNEIVIIGGRFGGEAIDLGMSEPGHLWPYPVGQTDGEMAAESRRFTL